MVDKFYYFVSGDLVRKCTMRESASDRDIVYIKFLDENNKDLIFEHIVFRNSLYEELAEAELTADFVRDLYSGFVRKPRVSTRFLKEHKQEFLEVQSRLLKELKNLHSVDFSYNEDDPDDYIGLSLYHKDIPMADSGRGQNFYLLMPSFSDKNEVINEIIDDWREFDTPENIKKIKRTIAEFNEYGFD